MFCLLANSAIQSLSRSQDLPSQLDSRYFRDVAGRASWTMDFTFVKLGQQDPIADSGHSDFFSVVFIWRSDYIVYVSSRIQSLSFIAIKKKRVLKKLPLHSGSYSRPGNALWGCPKVHLSVPAIWVGCGWVAGTCMYMYMYIPKEESKK